MDIEKVKRTMKNIAIGALAVTAGTAVYFAVKYKSQVSILSEENKKLGERLNSAWYHLGKLWEKRCNKK